MSLGILRDVSRGDSVKLRPHTGASTEGLTDHIKPAIRKKPEICGNTYRHESFAKELQYRVKGKEIGKCSKRG